MSKEKKEEYAVTVLSRDEVTTYPRLGEAAVTVLVTYIAAGLPPHTVHIPKDEWSPEEERKRIRASIEKRLKAKPETYKV